MNVDLLNSLKLTGMGMAAIFIVILIIYFAVHLILKLSNRKKTAGGRRKDHRYTYSVSPFTFTG